MPRSTNATFVSIDGVISHTESWHFGYVDEEATQIATGRLLASGALMMGRRTHEAVANAWPEHDGAYADSGRTFQSPPGGKIASRTSSRSSAIRASGSARSWVAMNPWSSRR